MLLTKNTLVTDVFFVVDHKGTTQTPRLELARAFFFPLDDISHIEKNNMSR